MRIHVIINTKKKTCCLLVIFFGIFIILYAGLGKMTKSKHWSDKVISGSLEHKILMMGLLERNSRDASAFKIKGRAAKLSSWHEPFACSGSKYWCERTALKAKHNF